MPDYTDSWLLSEGDGFFFASTKPGRMAGFEPDGPDLGRGAADTMYRFATYLERAYFLSEWRLTIELNNLRRELADLHTVRGANRLLREVRAAKRAERTAARLARK